MQKAWRGQCEFLPADTSSVTLVRDPQLRTGLLDAIHILKINRTPGGVDVSIWSRKPLPVGIGFDVLVVNGEESMWVGSMAGPAGSMTAYSLPTAPLTLPPEMKTATVVLRANRDVAAQTVDTLEIWDGELVYENVPVR